MSWSVGNVEYATTDGSSSGSVEERTKETASGSHDGEIEDGGEPRVWFGSYIDGGKGTLILSLYSSRAMTR